ncbi:MAG: hypothetical protein Q9178_005041 [Gyalolechia marmorata]
MYSLKNAYDISLLIIAALQCFVAAELEVPRTTPTIVLSPSTSLELPWTITSAATTTEVQKPTLLTIATTPTADQNMTSAITSISTANSPSAAPSTAILTGAINNAKLFIEGILPYGNPFYAPDPIIEYDPETATSAVVAAKPSICGRIFQMIAILVFLRIGLDVVEDLRLEERTRRNTGVYRGNNSNFVYVS